MEVEQVDKKDRFKRLKKIYFVGSILIAIYLLIQIFPPLWVLDSTTMKHYVFSLLNVFSIIFILFYIRKKEYIIPQSIFKNKISYSWLLLILIMLVSFFQSMNIAESIVTLNRWLIIYLLFIYFSIFLNKKPSLFRNIVNITIIISVINVLWCIIAYYVVGAHVNPRNNLYLNGFYGNKNIFAAAILFKLPFLYYAFVFKKNWTKWFSLFLIFSLTFCLVILSARTSFIGLIMQLTLLFAFALFIVLKLKKSKKIIFLSLIIISSALLGFVGGDRFLKYNFNRYCVSSHNAQKYDLTEDSYSVSNRFKSIEEGNSKGRLKIWRNTITIIKDNPIKGYGVGNHKLAIMKVETPQKFNFIVSDHAHNDYLEMWSELGIFGLIIYLLLFTSAFFLFIKTQWKTNISKTTRFISFVGLLCVVNYMNDAMFNFPLERADCQLYLALGMVLILVSYIKTKKETNPASTKKIVFYIIAFLTIGITTIETMHYMSSILQKTKILQTNGNKRIKFTAEQWNKIFPPLPTIDENANPIALTKGMRYDAEKNWRKAIDVIINDKSNPYLALKEYRLSNYYFKLGMQDSAEYWARESMKMKPLCYDPVKILVRKYSKENRYDISDTIITNYISKYKFNKNSYLDLIDVKLKLNQKEEILNVLDSALYYFPDDLTFMKKREEIDKNNEEK
ncbi:MAG: hypothetical protein H6Q16_1811 [Bacteroidetes bacterium]|nr:hypothetical protein [Bacteroidota bacterium]